MAVLLRDLHIVKICGGSHGGSQGDERAGGRLAASSGGLGEEGDEQMEKAAGWTRNAEGGLKQRANTQSMINRKNDRL